VLVRKKILDIEVVYEQWGGITVEAWEKIEPIAKAWMEEGETNVMHSFEYLYNEVKKKIPQYVVFKEWIANQHTNRYTPLLLTPLFH
jgi:hypothetical protein